MFLKGLVDEDVCENSLTFKLDEVYTSHDKLIMLTLEFLLIL